MEHGEVQGSPWTMADNEEEEDEEEEEEEEEEEGETEMEIVHETGVSAHTMIDAIMDEVSTHVYADGNDNESENEEGAVFTGTIPHGSDSPMTDVPGTSSEGTSAAPSTSSEGAAAASKILDPPTKTIPVNECLISLLLKLYTKLSDKNAKYMLPRYRTGHTASEGPFVGGGVEYIQRFLDKVSEMDERIRNMLEEHSRRHLPTGKKKVETKKENDSTEDRYANNVQ